MPTSRRSVAGAVVLLLAVTLAACGPNVQTVRSGGTGDGNTLRITLVDDFAALIGGELLGASEVGSDQLSGDLTEVGSGKWRGDVTASADREIATSVLGSPCETVLKGTQEVEVVATRGTYEEGRNLRLVLTPTSPPDYATYPSCGIPVAVTAPNGIEWLWFYFDKYRGGALDVQLPDKPGGTWKWEYNPADEYREEPGCGDLGVVRCRHSTTLKVEYVP